jgi:ankyrin repeat protein
MKGKSKEQIAAFFNDTTDTMGNHLLHVCASYGAYDVMDELLNIEMLECDPLTRRDKDTPIHCAVKYANEREVELGEAMVKMLIDAGGDPRVKDGHGRKPAELCTPRTEQIRTMLGKEEYIMNEGLKNVDHEEDEGATGSASDSE